MDWFMEFNHCKNLLTQMLTLNVIYSYKVVQLCHFLVLSHTPRKEADFFKICIHYLRFKQSKIEMDHCFQLESTPVSRE